MHLARINFGKGVGRRIDKERLWNKANWYISELMRDGQIYSNSMAAWTSEGLVAQVEMPFADSLDDKHLRKWGQKYLAEVCEAFGRKPTIVVTVDEERLKSYRPNHWKRSKSLYLYANSLTIDPPIRAGDTGDPIPAYLLKPTGELSDAVRSWAISYRGHESVWYDSSTLETQAYRQLADPNSELSERGLAACALMEAVTGKPTYYYLTRYHGRIESDIRRRCPGCGKRWSVSSNVNADRIEDFHLFPLRCTPCRLVSHHAVSFNDERRARIGEFKRRS
jgi:predicted  nucleic acid-binding Zn ribbon protein